MSEKLKNVGAPCRQADGSTLSVIRGEDGQLYLLMEFEARPDDDRLLRLDDWAAAYLAGVLITASAGLP